MKTRSYNDSYYVESHYGKRRRERKKRKFSLFDFLMLVLTLMVVGLLLLSYLAPWVDPRVSYLFAFLGLICPVLYIVTVVLGLYWILRWKAWLFLPLGALLLGMGYVPLFFRPMLLNSRYDDTTRRGTIKVMSYNVRGFISFDRNPRGESTAAVVTGFIDTHAPDILCMQEFQTTPKVDRGEVDTMLLDLLHKVVGYRIQNNGDMGWGLAIYSRYPIVGSGSMEFDNTTNSTLWADILVGRDTLRVINNHLQTTSINSSDYDFITSRRVIHPEDEQSRRQLLSIVHRLGTNYQIRASQADSVAQLIAASPYPVVVCGDFNDTPVSYTYRVMRHGLADAYCETGRGIINTYRGFFNFFRIDYVFHSPQLEAIGYQTPPFSESDHNPVITTFKIRQ